MFGFKVYENLQRITYLPSYFMALKFLKNGRRRLPFFQKFHLLPILSPYKDDTLEDILFYHSTCRDILPLRHRIYPMAKYM